LLINVAQKNQSGNSQKEIATGKIEKGAWDKNHFGFLSHAQKLINGGNRSNPFGSKPKFSKN
ncbi:hypothetical protein N4864_11985, partial [Enterococcus faecalis]|nr:hypothetical protein [Enterococcus faecalis]